MKSGKGDSATSESPRVRRYSLFPKPLGDAVTQVAKPMFKKHGFAEHRILTEWAQIVGAAHAAYSLPQKLAMPRGKKEGGTLYVLVASGRALELQHLQPMILSKIATYLGFAAVSRLVFTQVGTALFRKEVRTALKPPTSVNATVEAVVSQCEDEDLRRALLALGSTIAAVEN